MKRKQNFIPGLIIIFVFFNVLNSFSQFKFYESSFNGGVTGTGYGPDYSGAGSINLVIQIAPGSTIHQAYLFAGRHGTAAPLSVGFGAQSLLFDNINQVSPTFNSLYGGASGVHAIDVTPFINPAVNSYTLVVPAQPGPNSRYQDFFLYVAFENIALPLVNSAIFLNTLDFGSVMNYPNMTVINPISNNVNVGLSLMTGYICFVPGDGEDIFFNSTNLGLIGGADIGSGYCGGPMGSFNYENNLLSGLSDDNPDLAMDSADVLSNIQSIVVNNSTNFNMQFSHHNGASDNSIWAVFLTYGQSCVIPVANAGTDTTICSGDSVILTGSGGVYYQWSGGVSSNAQSVMVNPSATTNYYLVVSDSAGCQSFADTVTVFVNPNPVISFSGNTTICTGDSTTISASGGTSFQWSGGGISATTASVTVTPSVTTTYFVAVTAGNCSSTDSVTVIVNTIPLVSITGNTNICAGDSTILTASGGTSFQWNGGGISATTASVTITPSATTTYFVTVSNGNCNSTDSITVIVNAVPVVSINGNTNICEGQSTILTASGGSSFQWSGGGISATTASVTVTPSTTTTYFVNLSNGICSASGSIVVNVNPNPVIIITGNTSVCSSQSTTLTASGGSSYQWSGGGNSATTAGITVTPVVNTYYTVNVSNGLCNSTDSILVFVNPLPVAQISGEDSICIGESTTLIAAGGTSFQWSGDITSSSQSITVSPQQASTYILVVGDGNCFSNPVSINVTVLQLPIALFTYEFDNCTGVLSVASQSTNISILSWNFGDGASGNLPVQNHTYQNSGTYIITLSVTSSDNCADTSSVQVNYESEATEPFVFPNIITPNDDDKNDKLLISGLSNCSTYYLKIFSRWGILVFETDDPVNKPWNGRNQDNKLVDDGVYFFMLTNTEKLIKNGFITVIK